MHDQLIGVLALLCVPLLAAGLVAGPAGLVPRHVRASYRYWKLHRRLLPETRGQQESSRVSARLERRVRAACRNRCVACGRRDGLAVDHIVPWSFGGLTRFWNLAMLCRVCNGIKLTFWIDRRGVEHGKPGGRRQRGKAREIFAAEQRYTHSAWRWLRVLWAS